MTEREYNLASEAWVPLLSKNGGVEKKGLRDTMVHAHEYLDLGGEMRLQDVATMRLLTALSTTLMYRYDENGERSDLKDAEQAEERFRKIWKKGKFSEKAIDNYFKKWDDRFYLFGGKYPFYQIAEDQVEWKEEKNGEETVIKPCFPNGVYMNWLPMKAVNGLIQSSANKPYTPFKPRVGKREETAPYDEAARWLLYYNAFSDCVVGKNQSLKIEENGKKKRISLDANAKMTLPSRGAILMPVGKNLFQTIMLGSMLFEPGGRRLFKTCIPVWEEDVPEIGKVERPMPDDLARAYTQQARRMILKREGDLVTGLYAAAGESYTESSLENEPSFMMVLKKPDKTTPERLVPKHLSNDVDIWEEISNITGKGTKICRWINILLNDEDFVPEDACIRFRATDILYGSSCCSVKSIREDRITINRSFLTETECGHDAEEEIENIRKISRILYNFGNNCSLCMNLPKTYGTGKELERQYHTEIGIEVRKFLAGGISLQDLKDKEFRYAKRIADNYVQAHAAALLRGRRGEKGMTLGRAERIFYGSLNKM